MQKRLVFMNCACDILFARRSRRFPENWMRKPINCRSSSAKMTTSSVWACYTLDGLWGPHTINWFASHLSTQLSRFCGQFWCPGCEGVDAFSQCWTDEMGWFFPPPPLFFSGESSYWSAPVIICTGHLGGPLLTIAEVVAMISATTVWVGMVRGWREGHWSFIPVCLRDTSRLKIVILMDPWAVMLLALKICYRRDSYVIDKSGLL